MKNVGSVDALIRVLLGALSGAASLAILGGYLTWDMWISPVLGVVALILLYTGLTRKCPVYKAMGMDTSK